MGTDIINLHCKNEMVHFSNELVVIVIRCRSPDIFMIHMGPLMSVQQGTTQLQTSQQEIQLPLELFPLNFMFVLWYKPPLKFSVISSATQGRCGHAGGGAVTGTHVM